MSNYDMNTQQQQSQGYYPSENGYGQPYGQQYSQPSYPPYEQYPTETNQYQNQAPGANADYYNGSSMSESGTDDEKGLGSTIVGGAAGGYAAHHFGGGKMGTLAGAALGAAGMNAATHAM
ncbi:hypothetical protein N7492_003314 [Penicillium capsulatum]|uniref:Glycine zipper 2TM domain-containing protein n=1 Tax=Penicillium capsulatum TaxID=69766 RepID=A0A9W9IJD0_9EURO|nr:hypothetical protein N7492_003314 [Penicillium capsulatum]